ncbi:hypothetical protein DB347_16695 [Opitutaceae bacterium EW11]|nr:hypothetical protein DB347_16695 [Opitutaceae bacterium EW11]
MKTSSIIKALLASVLAAVLYTGCHTMEGAGKDIERGGEHLQNAADRANH